MMPRPRSRRKPLEVGDHAALVAQIIETRLAGGQPVAIVTDVREWRSLRAQEGAKPRCQFWPGGEETFDGVPIIIRRGFGAPKLMVDQAALEGAILE